MYFSGYLMFSNKARAPLPSVNHLLVSHTKRWLLAYLTPTTKLKKHFQTRTL